MIQFDEYILQMGGKKNHQLVMVISCPMISGRLSTAVSWRYILGTVIPSLPEEDRAGVLPENSEYQDGSDASVVRMHVDSVCCSDDWFETMYI